MIKLRNEEIVKSYHKYGVTLTTHRLIYDTGKESKEFFVKDLVGFTFVYKPNLKYLIPGTILLVIPMIISRPNDLFLWLIVFSFFALYILTLTKFLKLLGKNQNLQFKVKGMSTKELAQLTTHISQQSEDRNND